MRISISHTTIVPLYPYVISGFKLLIDMIPISASGSMRNLKHVISSMFYWRLRYASFFFSEKKSYIYWILIRNKTEHEMKHHIGSRVSITNGHIKWNTTLVLGSESNNGQMKWNKTLVLESESNNGRHNRWNNTLVLESESNNGQMKWNNTLVLESESNNGGHNRWNNTLVLESESNNGQMKWNNTLVLESVKQRRTQ
jgi:protein associated with RNAse G/E